MPEPKRGTTSVKMYDFAWKNLLIRTLGRRLDVGTRVMAGGHNLAEKAKEAVGFQVARREGKAAVGTGARSVGSRPREAVWWQGDRRGLWKNRKHVVRSMACYRDAFLGLVCLLSSPAYATQFFLFLFFFTRAVCYCSVMSPHLKKKKKTPEFH